MVCFCDLLFSQIKDHIDFYGDYGIGLRKKEWGLKKGVNPITYVPQKSLSAYHIQSISTEISNKLKNITDRKAIRKQLQNFYKYVKPYDGLVKNRKNRKNEYRIFYEEREWRFVPKNFPVLAIKEGLIQNSCKEQMQKWRRKMKGLIFLQKTSNTLL
nr:abortive infection system antitoxin AbiGi family protein [Hydrotalea sp.]